MQQKLLSREEFRLAVLSRDNNTCVLCDKPAADAHHILDRRLFTDGGYYLSNGASVCSEHHLACERTEISPEVVREFCGIKHPVLPPQLEADQLYDKWGNPVLKNGTRLRGELFFETGVQKILSEAGILGIFVDKVKYPRTWHVPGSPGATSDDRVLSSLGGFVGRHVVVTEKMDGENTSLYRTGIHARSVDSGFSGHASRDWVKNFHSKIAIDIPEGWRICGENLYAKHSIFYPYLKSYFYGFSVWNNHNQCIPWKETLEWFALLGIEPVQVLYEGVFDEKKIMSLCSEKINVGDSEGWVLRTSGGFPYSDFSKSVAKFVRARHVKTDKHWLQGPINVNGLYA